MSKMSESRFGGPVRLRGTDRLGLITGFQGGYAAVRWNDKDIDLLHANDELEWVDPDHPSVYVHWLGGFMVRVGPEGRQASSVTSPASTDL